MEVIRTTMSTEPTPQFEPLDLFDFPLPTPPSHDHPHKDKAGRSSPRLISQSVGDMDIDAELAMMEEEQTASKVEQRGERWGESPLPDLEEEPDWQEVDMVSVKSSTQVNISVVKDTEKNGNTNEETGGQDGLLFGRSEILDFEQPVASCKSTTTH